MKDLIDNLETIMNNAITAGTVSAKKVFKGLQNIPQMAAFDTEYPYIMIDDGGERTEENSSTRAQDRIYNVVFEMGCISPANVTEALDQILDLTDEVKTVLELEANRQKDGFRWGVEIMPFGWDEERFFFRGRRVVMEYIELEDTIDKY